MMPTLYDLTGLELCPDSITLSIGHHLGYATVQKKAFKVNSKLHDSIES